ncbi:uncharacterized protein LOC130745014 [Lotus japonicus]|uniref:uncharacterized protein LOC130745014 n=1 Tax=Lotus japonicus TaxID=34305 RepID=UPI002588F0D4|nr:uncharacterized protein LOC130745014 [Lotus japonicus]
MGRPPKNRNHNIVIMKHWNHVEQAILEAELLKHASKCKITRYAKAALLLHSKSIRDVAWRVRWMKEKCPQNLANKSSHFAPQRPNNVSVHAPTNVMMGNLDEAMSHKDVQASALNSQPTTSEVLEQNGHTLSQVSPIGHELQWHPVQNAHTLSQVSPNGYEHQWLPLQNAHTLSQVSPNLPVVDNEVNMINNHDDISDYQDVQALLPLTLEQNAHAPLSQVSSDPNDFSWPELEDLDLDDLITTIDQLFPNIHDELRMD